MQNDLRIKVDDKMSCSLSCRAVDVTNTTDKHKITVTVTMNGMINKSDSSTTKHQPSDNTKRNDTMADDTIPVQRNIGFTHSTKQHKFYFHQPVNLSTSDDF